MTISVNWGPQAHINTLPIQKQLRRIRRPFELDLTFCVWIFKACCHTPCVPFVNFVWS